MLGSSGTFGSVEGAQVTEAGWESDGAAFRETSETPWLLGLYTNNSIDCLALH